jgi:hypothetical protein
MIFNFKLCITNIYYSNSLPQMIVCQFDNYIIGRLHIGQV